MDTSFPTSLLSASVAERITYFTSVWVIHPYFQDALARVHRLLRLNQPGHIIVLNGPTGAGKTRLCHMVLADCINVAQDRMAIEPGYVPAFMVELAANHEGRFDWRDHFYRSLVQLEEPLLDRKAQPGELSGVAEWGTERVLRQAYENCLKHRHVELAIWDEAHHLRKVAGSRAFVEQMDTVKSIVNFSGTLHLLAGTYEILDLCDLSAELARRTYDIHLARYGDSRREQAIFANVVRSLQIHLPLAAQADLSPLADYLHERSLGCVGILKEWLTEALALAIDGGSEEVSEKELRQTGYSGGKFQAIRHEVELGEQRRHDMDGLTSEPVALMPPLPSRPLTGRRRPGQRRPFRDRLLVPPAAG